MPDIGIIQQIYIGGVITAFTAFMVVLAGGYFYVNSAPRQHSTSRPADRHTGAADDNHRRAA